MNSKWSVAWAFLLLILSVAYTPIHAQIRTGDVEVTFDDMGYGNVSLNGLYGMASIWIPLQNRWEIDSPLILDIVYTGSPLLNSSAAILTVKANGEAVDSIHPIGDGTPQTFQVNIPPSLVHPPGFLLEFSGFLKLTDEECEDANNPGQWLIIQNQTTLKMSPSITSAVPGLENLADALVTRTYNNRSTPIIFAVRDNNDSLLLTAAGRIASYLGTATKTANLPFTVKTISGLTERDKRNANLIVVGLPTDIPFWGDWATADIITPTEDAFMVPDGRVLPPESALIQLFVSPWNPNNSILVLSASGVEGIDLGGRAFADRQTRQTFAGPYAVVDDLVTLPAPQISLPWSSPQTTFRQLGEIDRRVTGIGNQDANYYFRLPPGWVFEPGAQLTLHMAFSPVLRSDESYAIVYINDIYVGTVNVDPNDGDIWAALDLPTRSLNRLARGGKPMNLDLRVAVANLLPIDSCHPINTEFSWTVVYDDSYFTIPHGYAELPDLYAFPYPFVSDKPTNPISIVLPQDPTPDDLQNAVSLAAMLGKYALPDISIEIVAADEVSQESHKTHNLIILGELARQPLIAALVNENDLMQIKRQIQQLDEANAGVLHSLTSPWSLESNALLVYGKTQTGYTHAIEALLTTTPPVFEPGSVALIRPDNPPLVFQREADLATDAVVVADQVISETGTMPTQEPLPTLAPSPEPTQTAAVSGVPTIAASDAATSGRSTHVTETERLILFITAFLLFLITLALLGRILFRMLR